MLTCQFKIQTRKRTFITKHQSKNANSGGKWIPIHPSFSFLIVPSVHRRKLDGYNVSDLEIKGLISAPTNCSLTKATHIKICPTGKNKYLQVKHLSKWNIIFKNWWKINAYYIYNFLLVFLFWKRGETSSTTNLFSVQTIIYQFVLENFSFH